MRRLTGGSGVKSRLSVVCDLYDTTHYQAQSLVDANREACP